MEPPDYNTAIERGEKVMEIEPPPDFGTLNREQAKPEFDLPEGWYMLKPKREGEEWTRSSMG